MPIVRYMDFNNPVWGGNSIQFVYDLFEDRKRCANVFEDMLHKHIVKLIISKWPREAFKIAKDIWFALWKIVRIDEAFALVKAAT
jgi:hypothetical protein